jgi:hypothetical protein
MEKYDYREAICDDIREWLENDGCEFKHDHAGDNGAWLRDDNIDEIAEELNDLLWANDSITGNGSGSYTFNTWKAEENLCHNLDLLEEAMECFGCTDVNLLEKGAEWCDVTIRCYLLSDAISVVLNGILEGNA